MAERGLEEENTRKTFALSVKKIVVIGPESTGKSTLSESLAKALGTVWVPEFARAYLETLNREYNEEDLLKIAEGQIRQEDKMLTCAKDFLICDTDLHVIKVWSEHKYQRCHKEILEQIAKRKYDLYLLTYIDVPWESDPLREHPEEGLRKYFYEQYKDIVSNTGAEWIEIKGSEVERLAAALKKIGQLQNHVVTHSS
jgi:NadR type nicotinamide-nucleotide adenylyltransferase